MTENIDLDKPIPPEWRVRVADSHLHSIGLSLFKPQLHSNRRLLYHPLLVFTIMLIKLIKTIIIIVYVVISKIKVHMFHMIMGNLDYSIFTGNNTNTIIIALSIFTIGS